MKPENSYEQFEDLKVDNDLLRKDLNSLFTPAEPIPDRVDRLVFDRADAHLGRKMPRLRIFRRAAVAAAVAAVILAGLTLRTGPALPEDIDRNGRVDILDAFTLARRLENNADLKTKWDFNNDGQVDREDVDLVAMAAVRLEETAPDESKQGV